MCCLPADRPAASMLPAATQTSFALNRQPGLDNSPERAALLCRRRCRVFAAHLSPGLLAGCEPCQPHSSRTLADFRFGSQASHQRDSRVASRPNRIDNNNNNNNSKRAARRPNVSLKLCWRFNKTFRQLDCVSYCRQRRKKSCISLMNGWLRRGSESRNNVWPGRWLVESLSALSSLSRGALSAP